MVSLNMVDYFVLSGACYDNLEAIRKSGARWDNGARHWTLQVKGHPLNNKAQKKTLQAMLNHLEENGVRFIPWYLNGKTTL